MLSGLTVLDLSQGIAGPYCGAILASQGANVVKVEPPAGDWARNMGVQYDGFTPVIVAYNVGKRSVCIDASLPEGRDVLRRLADRADILIQNFRPKVAERLGISFETLAISNPALLYVSISGFGASGPFADSPATDNVMQAISGMMHANRDGAGVPRQINLYLADLAAALYASQLVCAALYRREKDGAGRHIEVSLLEACAALQSAAILSTAFVAGTPPTQATAPAGVFATADGHVSIATLNNGMFERTCRAVEREDWLADARFASNPLRLQHRDAINADLAAALARHSTRHWNTRFASADVLYAPIQSYAELLGHPAAIEQNIFHLLDQSALLTALPLARHPGVAEDSPRPAPSKGQHSGEVLGQFGFAASEIERLIHAAIVFTH